MKAETGVFRIEENPVHLGLGAKVVLQEPFTDMSWYERYSARTAADGAEGRLVTVHRFSEPWDSWEMHPEGEELVYCMAGEIRLIQESPDGSTRTLTLHAGEAAINPAGVWHTADVPSEATVFFITAGVGTQHRSR